MVGKSCLRTGSLLYSLRISKAIPIIITTIVMRTAYSITEEMVNAELKPVCSSEVGAIDGNEVGK